MTHANGMPAQDARGRPLDDQGRLMPFSHSAADIRNAQIRQGREGFPPAVVPGRGPGVYLVVEDYGLFGCYLDESRAVGAARAINGVIAYAPIVHDFR